MNCLRVVSLHEVLSALLGQPQATINIVTTRNIHEVWQLDLAGIEGITSQLPGEIVGPDSGRVGTIKELYSGWIVWLHGTHPLAAGDLATHATLKSVLASGKIFNVRPVIYDASKTILDGKHRLFALYEYGLCGGSMPSQEVFWCK